MQVPADPADVAQPPGKAVGEGGGEDEGHTEPRRIDREQHDALGDGGRAGAGGQDGAENRPDAGGPAEGESEPESIGRKRSATAERKVEADVPLEDGNPRHAQHEQAEENDDAAADDVQLVAVT